MIVKPHKVPSNEQNIEKWYNIKKLQKKAKFANATFWKFPYKIQFVLSFYCETALLKTVFLKVVKIL